MRGGVGCCESWRNRNSVYLGKTPNSPMSIVINEMKPECLFNHIRVSSSTLLLSIRSGALLFSLKSCIFIKLQYLLRWPRFILFLKFQRCDACTSLTTISLALFCLKRFSLSRRLLCPQLTMPYLSKHILTVGWQRKLSMRKNIFNPLGIFG